MKVNTEQTLQLARRRRHRDRDAVGAVGRGMCPIHSRLGGLGKCHKLPQWGLGRRHSRKWVLVHCELENAGGNTEFSILATSNNNKENSQIYLDIVDINYYVDIITLTTCLLTLGSWQRP